MTPATVSALPDVFQISLQFAKLVFAPSNRSVFIRAWKQELWIIQCTRDAGELMFQCGQIVLQRPPPPHFHARYGESKPRSRSKHWK